MTHGEIDKNGIPKSALRKKKIGKFPILHIYHFLLLLTWQTGERAASELPA
jgi:hypothetical protein